MGTPVFSLPCLDFLYKSEYSLLAVVTQPDQPRGRGKKLTFSPVKQYALEKSINLLQPKRVKDIQFLKTLEQLEPDLIVVVAYGQILPKQLLSMPRFGCLNVHASILPKYRGASPIHRAVIAGEKETGITTMWMDQGLDTGDIFLQRSIPINFTDTVGVVHDKLAKLGAQVLEDSLKLIEQGKILRVPQEHTLASYAEKLTKDDEKIDWSKPAWQICNQVRGMSPSPGTYTYYAEKRIRVLAVRLYRFEQSTKGENYKPGQIVGWVEKLGPIIKTGEGYLVITLVQPAGKQVMTAEAYNLGNKFIIGSSLTPTQFAGDEQM